MRGLREEFIAALFVLFGMLWGFISNLIFYNKQAKKKVNYKVYTPSVPVDVKGYIEDIKKELK